MHFSIPDTRELQDAHGNLFTGYHVHINGVFHCTVRYSQLHSLNEQLKREIGSNLPSFPPKKLFPLTSIQVEERRYMLEKYIQNVSQDQRVITSETFNIFLVTAQQESQGATREDVDIDIFLMNGSKITVHGQSTSRTGEILKKVFSNIGLQEKYIPFFSLYLIQKEDKGTIRILRILQDFESPHISQKSVNGPVRIVLRKSYWDLTFDTELLGDKVCLNLLYIQTVADIERGWVLTPPDFRHHLTQLQAKGSKLQYMKTARSLRYYGYVEFSPCVCDYPALDTAVTISIGQKELIFRYDPKSKHVVFRVTRMRCWRITTAVPNNSKAPRLELAFEYLMSKDKLMWINIVSEQAVLISMCLQQMVDELLKIKENDENLTIFDGQQNGGKGTKMESAEISVKKLTSKFTTRPAGHPLIENTAFDNIGDDDL